MAFSWTQDLTARLINSVLDQVVRLGASYEGNFKKVVWDRIALAFNDGQPDELTRDRKQLQSKLAELKKKYKVYIAMKANSGFGWDPDTDTPTAPESVWDEMIAAHPQAKEFRTRPLFMYKELHSILSRNAAQGNYAAHTGRAAKSRRLSSSSSESSNESDVEDTTTRDSAARIGSRRRVSIPGNGHQEAKVDQEEVSTIQRRGAHTVTNETVLQRGIPKRQKTTGEKMSDAMRTMAEAQESMAASIALRQNRGRVLTCADEAIKIFTEMFTFTVPVAQRFKFVQLLATSSEAATMFSGMDDESRQYMVEQFFMAENSESDSN